MNIIEDKVKISDTAIIKNSTLKYFSRLKEYVELRDSILGDYSYISQYSIVNKTNIGKFCSISSGCFVGLWEHDRAVSTHSFYLYEHSGEFVKGYKNYKKDNMETNIGNDVWIGANAVVLKGVSLSDGCIVGGGAVVTKDVPSYAIAVGNPAKIIKYRYSKEDIDWLLDIKWWDFSRDTLKYLICHGAFEDFDIFKKLLNQRRLE